MIDYKKYILSTGTHYVSNSGSDEKGKYTGGTAGDQNGGEWALKAWYKRPWTVVLRHPDELVRTAIAQLGIEAALNDKIGYDQAQRYTYWTELSKAGFRPSKITTPCEEDCTAGVTANVKAVGELLGIKALKDLPKTITSRNMKSYFVNAGFQAFTDSSHVNAHANLLPGDILLYESHHAATNITKGANMIYSFVDVVNNIEEKKVEPVPGVKMVKITGGSVNARLGDSPIYKSVGYVKKNEEYEWVATSVKNGWHAIRVFDQICWVSPSYSKVVEA